MQNPSALVETSLPPSLLAGFHADVHDPSLSEIHHIGEQWAPRRFSIKVHSHLFWEFYLQISGETRWDVAGGTYDLCPGGLLAVPPHTVHHMHDNPRDRHHFFFVGIQLETVLERLGVTSAVWRDKSIVFVRNAEPLLPPFRHLVREVSLDLPHRSTGMRLALDSLVLESTRLAADDPPNLMSHTLRHPAVRRAKELLDHKPSLAWKLSDLAQMCDISSHHLVECFSRDVGVSPRQYLLSVRIDRAKEMLEVSDITITDIGLELGFSSSQHFAAVFKKIAGETAQGYRLKKR